MKCAEKGRYESRRIAEAFRLKRLRQNPTLYLRAYRCPQCGFWHLTSLPDRAEAEAS